MATLDLLLNLVGLLLWLGWRTVGFDQAARPAALSLASTLRRAEPASRRSYTPILSLFVLLLGRSVIYWQLGPAAHWTPTLDFGLVSLSVRSDLWTRMLLFSFLSFGQAWTVLYLILILFVLVNRGTSPRESVQALVEIQLGKLARWPAALLLGALPLAVMALWLLLFQPFLWLGMISEPPSGVRPWQQGLVLGLGAPLVWRWPMVVALAIYTINNYVYVGAAGWWNYAALAGQNLLRPLRARPFRHLVTFGKVDLAPVAAIALTLVGCYYLERLLRLLCHRPWF